MRVFNYVFICYFFCGCNSYEVQDRFYSVEFKKGEIKLWINKSTLSNEKDKLEFDLISDGSIKFDTLEIVLETKCCDLKYASKIEDSFFFEVNNIDELYNKNRTITVILKNKTKTVSKFKLYRKKKIRKREFILH